MQNLIDLLFLKPRQQIEYFEKKTALESKVGMWVLGFASNNIIKCGLTAIRNTC